MGKIIFIEFGTRLNFMSPTWHIWHIMMLVTEWNVTDMQKIPPTYFFVTHILKWTPSLRHQHNDVTNINVTISSWPTFFFYFSSVCVGVLSSKSPNGVSILPWSFWYGKMGVLIWFQVNLRNLNPRNFQILVGFSFVGLTHRHETWTNRCRICCAYLLI